MGKVVGCRLVCILIPLLSRQEGPSLELQSQSFLGVIRYPPFEQRYKRIRFHGSCSAPSEWSRRVCQGHPKQIRGRRAVQGIEGQDVWVEYLALIAAAGRGSPEPPQAARA